MLGHESLVMKDSKGSGNSLASIIVALYRNGTKHIAIRTVESRDAYPV
jgi:hypothetical protein